MQTKEEKLAKQRENWPKYKAKHRLARLRREALNPKARSYEKTARKLKKYNLTAEQYRQMFIDQNDLCAICKKPETRLQINGNKTPLSVDHNHKTGRVRALLCNSCNVGIATFKESISNMYNAIQYLIKHNERIL